MSTTLKLFSVLFLILCLAGCAHKQSFTESERIAIEEAITKTNQDIIQAAEKLDTEKLFSFMKENDKGILIQNGNLFVTKQNAFDSYKKNSQGLQSIEYKFNQQYITVISPNSALLVSQGESIVTTKNGNTFRVPLAQSVLFILDNGQWKVLHAHQSSLRNR